MCLEPLHNFNEQEPSKYGNAPYHWSRIRYKVVRLAFMPDGQSFKAFPPIMDTKYTSHFDPVGINKCCNAMPGNKTVPPVNIGFHVFLTVDDALNFASFYAGSLGIAEVLVDQFKASGMYRSARCEVWERMQILRIYDTFDPNSELNDLDPRKVERIIYTHPDYERLHLNGKNCVGCGQSFWFKLKNFVTDAVTMLFRRHPMP